MTFQFFHAIDDANAIVKLPKGVYKQTKVYRRGDRLFIPHSGGYVRICAKFGEYFTTSHPDVKVVEFDASFILNEHKEPIFR